MERIREERVREIGDTKERDDARRGKRGEVGKRRWENGGKRGHEVKRKG